jgi:hypothetical protein
MKQVPPFPGVVGRCSVCAGKWPANTPPILCTVTWEPAPRLGPGEHPFINPTVRRGHGYLSHELEAIGENPVDLASASRTEPRVLHLKRGQMPDMRCRRCKTRIRMRAEKVIARAEVARRERGNEFLLP